jgi:hypothetical protein
MTIEFNRFNGRTRFIVPLQDHRTRYCGAALERFGTVDFYSGRSLIGTNRFPRRCEPMAKASKTGKAIIPEPSFEFFLGALGVMLFLVIATAVYLSIHT